MEFCDQYFISKGGMIIDMPYLPRIVEGEVRILFVGKTPIFVVQKIPAKGSFSATLFSGSQYTYHNPQEWENLVKTFLREWPAIKERLGGHDTPILWTADFILDTHLDGSDKYVLGEINCSCVGFTSHLNCGIEQRVADEIIRVITEKKAVVLNK